MYTCILNIYITLDGLVRLYTLSIYILFGYIHFKSRDIDMSNYTRV